MSIVETVVSESKSATEDARRTYLDILRRDAAGTATDEDSAELQRAMRLLGKSGDDLKKDAAILKQAVALEQKVNQADADDAPLQLEIASAQRELDALAREFSPRFKVAKQKLVAAKGQRGMTAVKGSHALDQLQSIRALRPDLFPELNLPPRASKQDGSKFDRSITLPPGPVSDDDER